MFLDNQKVEWSSGTFENIIRIEYDLDKWSSDLKQIVERSAMTEKI